MALNPQEQFFETIKRSNTPLLCIPHGAGPDGYATALGLFALLQKLQKSPEIIAVDGPAKKHLHFLAHHEKIQSSLQQIRQLVIEIQTKKTALKNLVQEEQNGVCKISLIPEQGFWQEKEIQISHSAYRYDLLISIGANDLEAYAHIYKEYPDFFYQIPLINIDHSAANEQYGHINLIDLMASSCGEICYKLFSVLHPELLDEPIATAFLTGMIAKTKSFKTPHINPQTLQIAGQLLQKGAERENIVNHLYRTRSVSTLRLWGRALARLKHNKEKQLVWTLLSQQDFLHAGAEEQDLPDVIDELISTVPEAKMILLLYEDTEHQICSILRTEPPLDAMELAYPFRPAGTRQEARMCFLGKTIVQVEKEILSHLSV